MRFIPALVALFLTISSALSAELRDSVYTQEPLQQEPSAVSNPDEDFRWGKTVLPAAIFGIGFWGVENVWYGTNVNRPLKKWVEEIRDEEYFHADDFLQYLPAATYIVLGFAVEGEHSHGERIILLATSSLIMAAAVNLLKYTVCSMRPDGSSRNSFPSGHTATAMMGAELIRLEYGLWYGAGAYAIATGVAALRVYNSRHWSNDILGGAMVGILSANAAHWLLPLERKIPFLGKVLLSPAVFRMGGTETESGYGMALTLRF